MDFCCYEAGVLRKTEQCHYSCPARTSVIFTPRFSMHQEPIQKIKRELKQHPAELVSAILSQDSCLSYFQFGPIPCEKLLYDQNQLRQFFGQSSTNDCT